MIYKKGDFIGQKYEVYDILGIGGFGIVYLVYSHETESIYALKTFRDEYMEDAKTRERFKKEAQIWIDLERHPYIVRASFIDEISGRLYIAMEYIAADEKGLNTLHDYLTHRPPILTKSLRWAIQFCYGMEYAYSKGIRAHRDIKPANIMIGQDKAVKISDFGLAGVISTSKIKSGIKLDIQNNRIGLSCQTMEGTGFGTPTHMPPEQFTNAVGCDEKSDIYSFGIVLYQMATGGNLPFLASLPKNDSYEESRRFWIEMYKLHSKASIPKLSSPLFPIIFRCLEKKPINRYLNFKELRKDLENLLIQETGEVIKLPKQKELEAWEWSNKGISLAKLGRLQEAITCHDRALEIDPMDAKEWSNKGLSLDNLGRLQEAITCFDRALEIDPKAANTWSNKGISLAKLGRLQEAITCHDRALEIDPMDANTWSNKGIALGRLGKHQEAITCFDRALEIDPMDASAWYSKGIASGALGKYQEEIACYNRALEINPKSAMAWLYKGVSLGNLGKHQEAITCFDRALEIDPMDASAWYNKAFYEDNLGYKGEAIYSYKQFIECAPKQHAEQIEYAVRRISELEGKGYKKKEQK